MTLNKQFKREKHVWQNTDEIFFLRQLVTELDISLEITVRSYFE